MEVAALTSDRKLALSHAILLYQGNSRETEYASIHQAGVVGQQNVIQAGKPATKDGLLALFRSLIPASGEGLFHPRLLGKTEGAMIWFQPPGQRQVWVRHESFGGERHATVSMPGMVFVTTHSGWYVFAYKGRKRPDADTPLYVAPLFNVWAGGGICTGNIAVPQGKSSDQVEAWEDAFWRSWFTHPNIHEAKAITRHKAGFWALWKDLLDGNLTKFPTASLVKMDTTIGTVWVNVLKKLEA